MSFPLKLDVMSALCSELLPNYPRLTEYHKSLNFSHSAGKRNAVVHAKWGVNGTTKQVEISRLSARGKLKITMAPITVAEIRAASVKILESVQLLYELVTHNSATVK